MIDILAEHRAYTQLMRPAFKDDWWIPWRTILKQDPCVYCGEVPSPEKRTLEHVVPRSEGGKDSWDNIVGACLNCNRNRSNTPFLWWMVMGRKRKLWLTLQ